MLIELAIRDFAIIDAVRIEVGPGLTVLTGETGAGKSILIDALGAVLGDRVSADMVRTGARAALVDATFELAGHAPDHELMRLLAELETELDDGSIVLSREINAGGRSTARLNGRPTTAAILARIGALLVDIHGQSDHLSLLRPAAQLDVLDRFARITAERQQFAHVLHELRATRTALAESRANARDRAQRVDLLQFQVEEIERAELQPGEDERLAGDRSRLANAERLARDAAEAYAALAGDEERDGLGGGAPALRRAMQLWTGIAAIDDSAGPTSERLTELVYLVDDLAAEARDYRDAVEVDPARLTAVEDRLTEIRNLKRKYGEDIAAILAHARAARDELGQLTASEVDAEALAAREGTLAAEAGELAAALSQRRAAAGNELASRVEQTVAELNMGSTAFTVAIDRSEDERGIAVPDGNGNHRLVAADVSGVDHVQFLIAPNAGEAPKPLSRIASGGETARLMLALKSVLSAADETPTLVFDEIDVGVGGRSGQVVGEKLWDLTRGHQVIVISHLPQIAAFADVHFQIAKTEHEGRVVSMVSALEGEERLRELAAMIDGLPITPSSQHSAAEMLDRAASAKKVHRASF
jgi:DNA repair protein RecN (Recombination protein N)